MHKLTFDRTENNAVLIQIHSCAVTLWNIAVAMKTGSGQTVTTHNAKCKLKFMDIYRCTVPNIKLNNLQIGLDVLF